MALTLTELQAITDDYWVKTPTDIYFDDHVLLYKLMGKGSPNGIELVQPGELVDGGKRIRVPLEYANSHAGAYGNATLIPQSKKDILNAARFIWGGSYSSNAIDLNDRVQNSGVAAKVNLAATKLKNIQKSIRDNMGIAIYARSTDNISILGLGNLFYAAGTAYGEIDEADMAKWAAHVITTTEAIGFKVMQALRRLAAVGQNKSDKPNLYITTDLIKDGFERTLHVQARANMDHNLADAGFDNVLFGGIPIIADDKETAGYMEALNLNYLGIKTHVDFQFTTPKWEYDKEQPDKWVANTRWIGQLICSHRDAQARHTNLTEPA